MKNATALTRPDQPMKAPIEKRLPMMPLIALMELYCRVSGCRTEREYTFNGIALRVFVPTLDVQTRKKSEIAFLCHGPDKVREVIHGRRFA